MKNDTAKNQNENDEQKEVMQKIAQESDKFRDAIDEILNTARSTNTDVTTPLPASAWMMKTARRVQQVPFFDVPDTHISCHITP